MRYGDCPGVIILSGSEIFSMARPVAYLKVVACVEDEENFLRG